MNGSQRSSGRRFDFAVVCALVLVTGAASVHAVIFKSTADTNYNTSAPTGSLTNSGWQYEGSWGSYLGTPIAPCYFLAANHVGQNTGDVFTLNGYQYHAVWVTNCPGTDLNVWKVRETFPIYASLYTNANEIGKHCVIIGRGTDRGEPVIISGKTNGWKWGATNYVERWGENDITTNTSSGVGQLLVCTFDRSSANSNECHLSVGDSSGGMFIQDGSTWKLAGINYAVDGYFSTSASSNTQFDAALLDMGGLWVGSGTNWQFITNQAADIPSSFYSTRISANLAAINSIIDMQPGVDMQITTIEAVGDDISVSFASGSNRLYHVDRNDDLNGGSWTTFTNNVPGTGGIVSVLDTNAAVLPQRYYRLGLIQ